LFVLPGPVAWIASDPSTKTKTGRQARALVQEASPALLGGLARADRLPTRLLLLRPCSPRRGALRSSAWDHTFSCFLLLALCATGAASLPETLPQKGACRLNSTAPVGPSWRRLAVGPIPPADWDTRSTRSHLGKRPEHEIPDFCSPRGGPGGASRSGPRSPRKGLGPEGAWVRVGSWRGSDRQHRWGPGRPLVAAPAKGKRASQKLARYPVWRPLSGPLGMCANKIIRTYDLIGNLIGKRMVLLGILLENV
jgi:hypothetical protein